MLAGTQVQSLIFSDCKISSKKLKEVLKATKDLRSFSIEETDGTKPLCNKSFFSVFGPQLESLSVKRMVLSEDLIALKQQLKQVEISNCLHFQTFASLPPQLVSLKLCNN